MSEGSNTDKEEQICDIYNLYKLVEGAKEESDDSSDDEEYGINEEEENEPSSPETVDVTEEEIVEDEEVEEVKLTKPNRPLPMFIPKKKKVENARIDDDSSVPTKSFEKSEEQKTISQDLVRMSEAEEFKGEEVDEEKKKVSLQGMLKDMEGDTKKLGRMSTVNPQLLKKLMDSYIAARESKEEKRQSVLNDFLESEFRKITLESVRQVRAILTTCSVKYLDFFLVSLNKTNGPMKLKGLLTFKFIMPLKMNKKKLRFLPLTSEEEEMLLEIIYCLKECLKTSQGFWAVTKDVQMMKDLFILHLHLKNLKIRIAILQLLTMITICNQEGLEKVLESIEYYSSLYKKKNKFEELANSMIRNSKDPKFIHCSLTFLNVLVSRVKRKKCDLITEILDTNINQLIKKLRKKRVSSNLKKQIDIFDRIVLSTLNASEMCRKLIKRFNRTEELNRLSILLKDLFTSNDEELNRKLKYNVFLVKNEYRNTFQNEKPEYIEMELTNKMLKVEEENVMLRRRYDNLVAVIERWNLKEMNKAILKHSDDNDPVLITLLCTLKLRMTECFAIENQKKKTYAYNPSLPREENVGGYVKVPKGAVSVFGSIYKKDKSDDEEDDQDEEDEDEEQKEIFNDEDDVGNEQIEEDVVINAGTKKKVIALKKTTPVREENKKVNPVKAKVGTEKKTVRNDGPKSSETSENTEQQAVEDEGEEEEEEDMPPPPPPMDSDEEWDEDGIPPPPMEFDEDGIPLPPGMGGFGKPKKPKYDHLRISNLFKETKKTREDLEQNKAIQKRYLRLQSISEKKLKNSIFIKGGIAEDAHKFYDDSLQQCFREFLAVKKTDQKTVEKKSVKRNRAPPKKHLLDDKTAHKAEVGLRTVRLSDEEVFVAIRKFDEKKLPPPVIEKIYGFLPPLNVLSTIRNYEGGVDEISREKMAELSRSSQFCLRVSVIPKLIPKISLWYYKNCYDDNTRSIEIQLSSFIESCTVVIHSVNFKEFLQYILLVANMMSKKDLVVGFRLKSLEQLARMKVNNKSLLSYLVGFVKGNGQQKILKWRKEFKNHLKNHLGVNFDHVRDEIAAVGLEKDKLKNLLDIVVKDEGAMEDYVIQMKPFFEKIYKQHAKWEEMLNKVNSLVKELGELYAEDEDYIKGEFFKVIDSFIRQINQAESAFERWKKLEERKQRRKDKLEKKMKRKKKRKEKKNMGKEPETEPVDNHQMIDIKELQNKIDSGEIFSATLKDVII